MSEQLVAEGYALALTIPPNVRYAEHFSNAARIARENGLGLWSACADQTQEATRRLADSRRRGAVGRFDGVRASAEAACTRSQAQSPETRTAPTSRTRRRLRPTSEQIRRIRPGWTAIGTASPVRATGRPLIVTRCRGRRFTSEQCSMLALPELRVQRGAQAVA